MARLQISETLQRFMTRTPVTVMSRGLMEYCLSPSFIDQIFEETAERQYSRELLFSSVVEILGRVVFQEKRSVRASYLWWNEPSTSVVSLYKKLNGTETCVSEALVRRTAERMAGVIEECQLRKEPIRGLRLCYQDGNFLAATEHRIFKLHGLAVAALPGQTQVIFEHRTGLIREIRCTEDAHEQERSLIPGLYDSIRKNDLTVADSGYCMVSLIRAHTDREAFYLLRHHSGTTLTELGRRTDCGRCSTGKVYEAEAILSKQKDAPRVRALIIERDKPMADGTKTVILITNVPRKKAAACKLAELYLTRWTIEEAFRQLTQVLRCEVNTLGYPKAALLAFSIAVLAYNTIAVVRSAIEAAVPEKQGQLSIHAMAEEIASVGNGMAVAIDPEEWRPYATMTSKALARWMMQLAAHVDWRRFTKTTRGPKKPVTHRRFANGTHLSTARVLADTAAAAKESP